MSKLLQLKCLSDIKKFISEIEIYRARPIVRGKHPTLYEERKEGRYRTVMGVRVCDYQFSPDERWVLPNPKMGLSFSSTWDNLKFVYGMFKKRAKKKPVDIYWVLSEADIPPGLAFKQDSENSGHYFLAITERMLVEQLVDKLRLVAQRMSVMEDGGRAL
ncbi:hypothetical protein ACL7TT_16170 [Microbulbifer sp. 2304DJ12-6]|uniref:hypothetical protein n=1 Tax=Microbulbifer sp. 2304DJ12-6 TaxID=3233340 RepID=UPI0039AF0552